MSHNFTDFEKYAGTEFEGYILPIVPAGAKLTEKSKLTPDHLGKILGEWRKDVGAWTGFPHWQNHWAKICSDICAKAAEIVHNPRVFRSLQGFRPPGGWTPRQGHASWFQGGAACGVSVARVREKDNPERHRKSLHSRARQPPDRLRYPKLKPLARGNVGSILNERVKTY